MKPIRQSRLLPASAIRTVHKEGDQLVRFVKSRNFHLNRNDIKFIQSKICSTLVCHVIDVSSNTADGFYWKSYDTSCLLKKDLTDMAFREFPDQEYAAELKTTYHFVKESKRPRCSIEFIWDALPRSFYRFIQPFTGTDTCSQVLVASCYRDIAGFDYLRGNNLILGRKQT